MLSPQVTIPYEAATTTNQHILHTTRVFPPLLFRYLADKYFNFAVFNKSTKPIIPLTIQTLLRIFPIYNNYSVNGQKTR